jgi:hypothetical protein
MVYLKPALQIGLISTVKNAKQIMKPGNSDETNEDQISDDAASDNGAGILVEESSVDQTSKDNYTDELVDH